MFFYVTLQDITVRELRDHPASPFDRRIALYQTWHLCALEPAATTTLPESSGWIRQGFSARGAPDFGAAFGRETRSVVDPQITWAIPRTAQDPGVRSRYRFDAHYWESHSASRKVRSTFVDTALAYLQQAWHATKQNESRAKAALRRWLDDERRTLESLVSAGSPTGVGVVGDDLLPLASLIVDIAKSHEDAYHGTHQFMLDTAGTGEGLRWRVISPSGQQAWAEGIGRTQVTETVRDEIQGHVYDARWCFRMLE